MHIIGAPDPPPGCTLELPPVPAHAPPAAAGGLWLLRHGQVDERYHELAYGQMDVPLSARGREQTAALEEAFRTVPLAAVAASSLERARLLGEGLARATGAPLTVDAELREIHRGRWQGMTRAEFAERWQRDAEDFFRSPFQWRGHQGESDADVWTRVGPALDRTLAAGAGGDVAICCHFNVVRVLVTHCLGWTPKDSFAFRCSPGHLCRLEPHNGTWQLVVRDAERP